MIACTSVLAKREVLRAYIFGEDIINVAILPSKVFFLLSSVLGGVVCMHGVSNFVYFM